MWRDLLGIAAAFASSAFYNLGVSLQAAEAGQIDAELALRPVLLLRLAGRRRWLAGAAISFAGWPLQGVALLLAPLTLVQPALAAGLVILVTAGNRLRGARISQTELAGLAAIVLGVAGLAAAAPERTTLHASSARLTLVLGTLALLTLTPYLLRALRHASAVVVIASAGLASAWSGIATKLVTDELARRRWSELAVWLAVAAAAAALGLLSETSALQVRAPSQVVPAIFVIQMSVPVLLAPYLAGEHWTTSPAGGPPLALAFAFVAAGVLSLAHRPAIARSLARSGAAPAQPSPVEKTCDDERSTSSGAPRRSP